MCHLSAAQTRLQAGAKDDLAAAEPTDRPHWAAARDLLPALAWLSGSHPILAAWTQEEHGSRDPVFPAVEKLLSALASAAELPACR